MMSAHKTSEISLFFVKYVRNCKTANKTKQKNRNSIKHNYREEKMNNYYIIADTVSLLKECNAGVKMGVNSIAGVCNYVKDSNLQNILQKSKEEHQRLGSETHEILNALDMGGKEPHAVARQMAKMKIGTMMRIKRDDSTAADLITDGCNMGVKSLNRYLNEYEYADVTSRNIANRLIDLEEKLAHDISAYL